MEPTPFHPSLLRPPILHILRAAGFTTTRPSVLDTLVDLTSRYLTLLAQNTARHAQARQPTPHSYPPDTITVTDVRLALQDAGALWPAVGEVEEQARMGTGEGEDMRGVEAFVGWCVGEGNREIRRIAGMDGTSSSSATLANTVTDLVKGAAAAEAELGVEETPQDFLTLLKRKHAKTKDGEEARYSGTVLGRDREEGEVRIEGWEVQSLNDWGRMLRERNEGAKKVMKGQSFGESGGDGDGDGGGEEVVGGSESDSPLSEISGDTMG